MHEKMCALQKLQYKTVSSENDSLTKKISFDRFHIKKRNDSMLSVTLNVQSGSKTYFNRNLLSRRAVFYAVILMVA